MRTVLALAACGAWVAVLHGQTGAVTSQAPAQAQSTTEQPISFDVVSVKPHKDEGMQMRIGMRFLPDGFTADGIPLRALLHIAFDLSSDRILNQPEWINSSRFDIAAKVAPEDAPKLKGMDFQQRGAMLVSVLQDRFGLKFHHEIKEMEVYTLVVAKGGPKLKEATPEELAATAPPPRPDGPGGPPGLKEGQVMMRGSPQGMTLETRAATMTPLVRVLTQQTGSTVADKTGLTGNYDYTLTFMPDQGGGGMILKGPPPTDEGEQSQDPPAPSIFTALQEQLGLKLVPQKEKVDVIVIDHIEQPSAN